MSSLPCHYRDFAFPIEYLCVVGAVFVFEIKAASWIMSQIIGSLSVNVGFLFEVFAKIDLNY